MGSTGLVDQWEASAKWFLFATAADDGRRRRYGQLLARWRAAGLRQRQTVAAGLPASPLAIPATGFLVDQEGALGSVEAVVAEVRRRAADLSPPRAEDGTKPYLHDYAMSDLDPESPLAEFAVRPEVVAAASAYLGAVPILSGIHVMRSPHVVGPPRGSQLFHSDWEDLRQVKVFVSCTDVTAASGPLTAVSAPASRRVKEQVGYHYGGREFRLRDDQVLPHVDPSEVQAFTGPAGTVTFIDTSSCLHYGSRLEPEAEPRLVIQFQYLNATSFDLVVGTRRRPRWVRSRPGASPAEQLLLGRPSSSVGR